MDSRCSAIGSCTSKTGVRLQCRFNGVEVVWHGKPISGGSLDPNYGSEGVANAQRIQGFVGIDTNGDNQFNYGRYLQTVSDPDQDPSTVRLLDVNRTQDFNDNNNNGIYDAGDTINQEPFAANVVVDAYRVWDGVPEAAPVARFLTGADGNYYFDLDVQGDLAQTGFGKAHAGQTLTYQIRATDPLGRAGTGRYRHARGTNAGPKQRVHLFAAL